MEIKITRKSEHVTSLWSGGTTCQLAISPEDSSYKERNFDFRLSTASIETEESSFTRLPGISRTIMILEGELKLEHKKRHTKTLKKFDTDCFQGDWNTISFGKARDFNLMTSGNVKGVLESIPLKPNEINAETRFDIYSIIGYYLLSGSIEILDKDNKYLIEQGDLILMKSKNQGEQIISRAIEGSDIIVSAIQY